MLPMAATRTTPETSPVLRMVLSFAAPGLFHIKGGQIACGGILLALHWMGLLLGTVVLTALNGYPWSVLLLWVVWQVLLARWSLEVPSSAPSRPRPPLLLILVVATVPALLAGTVITLRHGVAEVPAMDLEAGRDGSLWVWTAACCTRDCARDGDLVLLSRSDTGGHHLTRLAARPSTGAPEDPFVHCPGAHALRSAAIGSIEDQAGGPWRAQAAKTGQRIHLVWDRPSAPAPGVVPIPHVPPEHLAVLPDVRQPESQDTMPAVLPQNRCQGRATHVLWADDLALLGRRL